MIPKTAAADLHAASPDEVVAILDALENANVEDEEISQEHRLKARAAVALQFFAGLRPGEARGASWEDWRVEVVVPRTQNKRIEFNGPGTHCCNRSRSRHSFR